MTDLCLAGGMFSIKKSCLEEEVVCGINHSKKSRTPYQKNNKINKIKKKLRKVKENQENEESLLKRS